MSSLCIVKEKKERALVRDADALISVIPEDDQGREGIDLETARPPSPGIQPRAACRSCPRAVPGVLRNPGTYLLRSVPNACWPRRAIRIFYSDVAAGLALPRGVPDLLTWPHPEQHVRRSPSFGLTRSLAGRSNARSLLSVQPTYRTERLRNDNDVMDAQLRSASTPHGHDGANI